MTVFRFIAAEKANHPVSVNHPFEVIHIHDWMLDEYDNGAEVALVAFRLPQAV